MENKLLYYLILITSISLVAPTINLDQSFLKESSRLIIFETYESNSSSDKVSLYYENKEIILQVNDQKKVFLTVNNQEEVFGNNSKNKYIFEVFVEGKSILVASTYTFVNKYGSAVYLKHFLYENNDLEETWRSDNLLEYKIIINEYNEKSNTIQVLLNNTLKEIIIDSKNKVEVLSFFEFYKNNNLELPIIEPRIIKSYEISDLINDNRRSVVIKMPVTCGASPIQDELVSVYNLSNEGFEISNQWFESKYKE